MVVARNVMAASEQCFLIARVRCVNVEQMKRNLTMRHDDIDEEKFERFVVRVCLIVLVCVFIYGLLK